MKRSEAKDIQNRIEIARRLAKEVYHPERRRAMEYYRGEQWGDAAETSYDQITVNYLYPIVETKVAAIAFRYPDFTLKSLTREASQNEMTVRSLLAYTFRRGKFLLTAKRVFRDYQIGGVGVALTGWLQSGGPRGAVGWTSTFGRSRTEGEPIDPTPNALPDVGSGLGARGSGLNGLTPSPEPRGPSLPLKEDRPFLSRIPPQDFWVSPEANAVLDDALYCGYTERLPVEQVKGHPRYKNTGRLVGTTDNLKDLFDEELRLKDSRGETSADLRRVTLHHYWDRPRLRYVVMAEEGNVTGDWAVLYDGDWPCPYIDRYPFRVLRAPDDEDRFWPMPTLSRYEHPQREINTARSLLARHQRQSVRKYQYNGRLSEFQKKQLRSDGSLGVVELEGPEKIAEIPHAHVNPEIFRSEEAAKGDLQLLAAMNAYESFENPTYRKTQAEAQAIAAAGGARAKAEQEEFEALISGIGQDTLTYLQEYSVAAGEMPVFENGEVTDWRAFTLEEIRGDYWVEVYVGSTMVPNRQRLAEQLGLIMQSAPNLVQGIMAADQAGMDFRALLRSILEGMPEIRDPSKIVPDLSPEQRMLTSLPPGALEGMAPPGNGPGAAGAGTPAPPFPGTRPDGSVDIAQLDQWLRGMSDEDLASYVNGAH